MALTDNALKIGGPILLGVGVLILAPAIIPAAASVVKPLAKAAIKGGLVIFQRSRELIAETAEAFEDLTAEVRAELLAEQEGQATNPES